MEFDNSQNYRPNVGIVLVNAEQHVFVGKRAGKSIWQFPQGGIIGTESAEEALFRELYEEVGLQEAHVEVLTEHPKWLSYDFNTPMRREDGQFYRGQLQKWFLLRFLGSDSDINVQQHEEYEFDDWRWVDFWEPLQDIVDFKRDTYEEVLRQFGLDLGIAKTNNRQ